MDRDLKASPAASADTGRASSPETGPGWSVPKPEKLPHPTWVPAALALGIVFLLWGIATTWLISGVGFVLFLLSLAQWIRELWNGA
jgi:hypothetical protein